MVLEMKRAKSLPNGRRLMGMLLGMPGSGKTWTATTMPGPRAYIVCDPNAVAIIARNDPSGGVFEVNSAEEMREAAEAFALKRVEGFKSVIVDSLHYYQSMLRRQWFAAEIASGADIPGKKAARVTDETEVVTAQILASGLHVLFLCHSDEREMKTPGTREARTIVRPMLSGQGRTRIPGACNFVGMMERRRVQGGQIIHEIRTSAESEDMMLKSLPGQPEIVPADMAQIIEAAFGAQKPATVVEEVKA